MRRLLAFLAAVAAFALPACTRVATTQTTPGAETRHSWTQPGVLRIASLNDPDSLSPLVGNFQVDVDLSMFWAGYLFNFSDANALVPELATDVPTLANGGISKDGLTITYHLRRGVTWQDGAPFSADDVVFSWHAVMNPNTNVPTRLGYDLIRAIDEPDQYTAVVHLAKPYAPFVNTFFTMGPTPYPVYPKHLLAKYHDLNQIPYNSKPVGTGPFIVQEWHRGQTLRMVANPHYWRGAPKLREVEYRVIPDENTIVTSLQTHEIDMWYYASATNYASASKIEGTHALLTPFAQYSLLGFNLQREPTSELAVRRALAYATDRKRLIDVATYGVNILGEGDQPAFSWAYDASLQPIPYDPAKARALLDAAGWRAGGDGIRVKNGKRLHVQIVTTSGNALGNRVAVILQAAWKDVGVEAEVKAYTSSLMFAVAQSGGILQSGKFDVEFSAWIPGVDPDDALNFMCDRFPPNGENQFRFCDKTLDAQEKIALTSNEQSVRKAAYTRIQEILIDQLPMLTMWFNRRFDVVNNDLKNYKPAHAVTTFWNTWEYAI
ncbi:MAG: peptide ABC transporter substrate-binding protein [Candidatus Eremiobacteraeota bacterium]|nr:peptide ABC transporter substrate-binding protein [Candidatus Eremiobacteraeota bacterium]